MSDLTAKINEILNSEEGMNQVRNLANSLGLTPPSGENWAENSPPPSSEAQIPQINPQMLMNLQNIMSSMNTQDENSSLLQALKPHLSQERQKKVDDAVKIMHLVKLFPILKQSGLFGGDKS